MPQGGPNAQSAGKSAQSSAKLQPKRVTTTNPHLAYALNLLVSGDAKLAGSGAAQGASKNVMASQASEGSASKPYGTQQHENKEGLRSGTFKSVERAHNASTSKPKQPLSSLKKDKPLMKKQEPKSYAEGQEELRATVNDLSAKQDQEDDYQDIDEKSIAEPNYLGRQQVYVSLDKEEQSEPGPDHAKQVVASLEGKKAAAVSQFQHKPESYKNQYLNLQEDFRSSEAMIDIKKLNIGSDSKLTSLINKTLLSRGSEIVLQPGSKNRAQQ